MKIRPVGAELLRADGQADVTKLYRNSTNAPNDGRLRAE